MTQVRSSSRRKSFASPKDAKTLVEADENADPGDLRVVEDRATVTPSKRTKGASMRARGALKPSDLNQHAFEFELVDGALSKDTSPARQIKVGSVETAAAPPLPARDKLCGAKKLFHRSTHTRIVGRSSERSTIDAFWTRSVLQDSGVSRILYMCGTPGTGKTALLGEMLSSLVDSSVTLLQYNCMMFEKASDVLVEIATELHVGKGRGMVAKGGGMTAGNRGTAAKSGGMAARNRDAVSRSIVAELSRRPGKTVLVLDEIDELAHNDAELLETIFHWATDPACKLTVIGIANSIDLTARRVPASLQVHTETLYFAPYQIEDITAILSDRMNQANSGSVLIQPVAIELCSRKVAAVGDLRKALEVMQIAFELAEQDPACEQVQFLHVVRAMERAFPASSRPAMAGATGGIVDQVNMNARMVLVSLILFQDENPIPAGTRLPYKKATLQNVFDRYQQLLKLSTGRSGTLMTAVSRDEFLVLLSDLETFNILTIARAASGPGRKPTGHKSMGVLPDWQASVIKLSVADRSQLVASLKAGGITRLFLD